MLVSARAGSGGSQAPRTPAGSATWLTGTQEFGLSFAALLLISTRSMDQK